MSSSYTITALNPDENPFLVGPDLVEFNPGKYVLLANHAEIAQQIIDIEVRKDDVWLLCFVRTGSTLCHEILWLMMNNLDFDSAQNTLQKLRAPSLELSSNSSFFESTLGKELAENYSTNFIANLPSPRVIKSHLHLPLLPRKLDIVKPKIIYICRNPKDLCVSYYHLAKTINNSEPDFQNFCNQFIEGKLPYSPVLDHFLTFWKKRHEDNILFLKYEDLNKDLRSVLKTIANFLGKSYTEDDYDKLCDFLSFEKMKRNRSCNFEIIFEEIHGKNYYEKSGNHFIRKGIVGDWKNYMSEEMSKKFDDWIDENLGGSGLSF